MGRLQELLAMLGERRVGFRIDETMRGTHRFVRDFPAGKVGAGTELPLAFRATWGHPRVWEYFNPAGEAFLRSPLEGRITAGGLCLEAPLAGTLELRYLQDATVRYRFEFEARGQLWRYQGEKRDIRPWNLHRTHTTCYGTISEAQTGEPLSDSVTYFDLKQLPRFLLSLRPA